MAQERGEEEAGAHQGHARLPGPQGMHTGPGALPAPGQEKVLQSCFRRAGEQVHQDGCNAGKENTLYI